MPKKFNKPITNPFLGDQFFETEVLAKDPQVQETSEISLKDAKARFLSQTSFFRSLKEKYVNFAHLISKNAIVATIIMLFALTAVGASAAELFAPEEFKPSTQIQNLFGANKQKETDPYTALKPDDENDVVDFVECDLAIKYPKQIQERDLVVFYNTPSQSELDTIQAQELTELSSTNLLSSVVINGGMADMDIDFNTQRMLNNFDVACYNIQQERDQIISREYYESGGDELNQTAYYEISKEELRKKYGWFITEGEIKNIAVYETQGLGGQGDSISQTILFDYQDKLYSVSLMPAENDFSFGINPDGVFAEQIQMQFNSLVKNEANSEIQEQPEPEVEIEQEIQPLVADENHDVVVIEECDLAVRYANLFKPDIYNLEKSNYPFTGEYYISSTFIKNYQVGKASTTFDGRFDINCVTDFEDYFVAERSVGKNFLVEITNKPSFLTKETWENINEAYTSQGDNIYYFLTADRAYNVVIWEDLDGKKLEEPKILIQSNSLAPSTPSITLNQEKEAKSQVKSYTNQYFPNFKINYDESWRFETTTTPSETHKNLLERSLIFKKGNSTLSVFLKPLHTPSGCGGYTEGTYQEIPVGDHFRIHETHSNRYVYSAEKDPTCILGNLLDTSIKASDVVFDENYIKINGGTTFYKSQNKTNITYTYFITLESNNRQHIQEADEIIKNSVLR